MYVCFTDLEHSDTSHSQPHYDHHANYRCQRRPATPSESSLGTRLIVLRTIVFIEYIFRSPRCPAIPLYVFRLQTNNLCINAPGRYVSSDWNCGVEHHNIHNGEVECQIILSCGVDPVSPAPAQISVATSRYCSAFRV